MPKTYVCGIQVRGYEMDSLGHVNHAVYFNYLEHARWELLSEEGITREKFAEWQISPVIAAAEIQYLRATKMGDRLEVRSQVVEHGRSSFKLEQVIYRGDEEVARARLTSVMINDRGKATRLPDGVSRLWLDAPGAGE